MKRASGILMPVFSLPGGHGIGDFGPAAFSFVELLASHGIANWQILPLNAGNPENGESPYFSGSAFAINPLLLSLQRLHAAGLLNGHELAAHAPHSPDLIRYDELRAAKWPLLTAAAQRYGGGAEFDAFCDKHRFWLDDFALFDALRRSIAQPWTQWPAALREREPGALDEARRLHTDAIRVCKVLQFLAYEQWNALQARCGSLGVTIIGDMPIYIAHDSADCWSQPRLFELDDDKRPRFVSGVPPDLFSATGQLWNNPVYEWERHREDGFQWWVRRMRHLFSLYDVVRIDHFRGLVQYWEIPQGEPTAINGAWRDVPTYALFDTLIQTIEPFPVICEDLGIITDDVRRAMNHYRFPGMKILQFAFGDDDPAHPYLPHNYDDNCIVYTGTHDNMPTLPWLQSAQPAEMARIVRAIGSQADHDAMVWELIGMAMDSRANLAIVPLQDLLGLGAESRINNPAFLQGNWQWRWNPERFPPLEAFEKMRTLIQKTARE